MPKLHGLLRVSCAGTLAAALALCGKPATPRPHAQQSVTPSTAQNAAGATTLRTSASLVLIDIVVTDHGNPVHSLDRSHFHVLEDGHAQAIATFDEHRPPAAPSTDAHPPALPPHTYTNLPSYPPGSAVNILLLDALNTPMASQMDVRRQMIQYLGKIPPGTQLGIFALSSRLRMIEGITTDPAQLARTLQSSRTAGQAETRAGQAAPQTSVLLDPQTDQALDSTIGDMTSLAAGTDPATVAGVSALGEMRQFIADVGAFQTDLRVRITLDAMQQVARYLSGIPGRKNLIWFSGSFPIALDPDDTQDDPFEAMRSYSDEIRETAELLAAARVAVYPVDARGLMTPPTLDASYTAPTNLMGGTSSGNRSGSRRRTTANKPSPSTDDLNRQKQLIEEQASMQQIAQQTGGREYLNTNGLHEAVASAIENGSSYYTIGYVPAARPLDGQFRKIQVNLESSDYKLAYRHGYYADPSDKPNEHRPGQASLMMAATLHGAPPATQILLQARVLPTGDPGLQEAKLPAGSGGELVASLKGPLQRQYVDLNVDPHTLHYDIAADGTQGAQVEFTLVAYDRDGRRVNYLDSGFQLGLKPSQIQQTMESGIRIRLPLDLPAGQFSLRIAVHDLSAGRAGSLEMPVYVNLK